jgi:hypothetical protein
MGNEEERKWSYLSPIDGKTVGPLSTKEMRDEIESKGLASSVLVFSYDLNPAEWTPLCKVEDLRDSIGTDQLMFEKMWYYLDGMIRKGPFAAAELRTKLQTNEIDGFTKIWSPSRGDKWTKLSECEELKLLLNGGKNSKRKRSFLGGNTKKTKKRKKKKVKNSWIYITGLDNDITVELLVNIFSKYGLIDDDVLTNEPRVKIYRNQETGLPKGDASICFVKEPSVELAISMMDEVEYKPGFKIRVKCAVWDKKKALGEKKKDDETKQPKWKEVMTEAEYKARLEAKRKRVNAKLGWKSTAQVNTVILRNVFDRNEIRSNPLLLEELKKDMRIGASQFGKVKALKVAENNPEGIVIIHFKSNISSNPCVEKMNGRFYGGRMISAALWDGYTNHVLKESEDDRKKREEEFGVWLESVTSKEEEEEEKEKRKDETSITKESTTATNILEEYTENVMSFLMSPKCALSEEIQDKITEKLDEAAEWMIENRSSLHNNSSLRKKRMELESVLNPMLKGTKLI